MKAKFGLATVDVWKIDRSDENLPEFVKNGFKKKRLAWGKLPSGTNVLKISQIYFGSPFNFQNDWLVADEDGNFRAVSAKTFNKDYKIIDR